MSSPPTVFSNPPPLYQTAYVPAGVCVVPLSNNLWWFSRVSFSSHRLVYECFEYLITRPPNLQITRNQYVGTTKGYHRQVQSAWNRTQQEIIELSRAPQKVSFPTPSPCISSSSSWADFKALSAWVVLLISAIDSASFRAFFCRAMRFGSVIS